MTFKGGLLEINTTVAARLPLFVAGLKVCMWQIVQSPRRGWLEVCNIIKMVASQSQLQYWSTKKKVTGTKLTLSRCWERVGIILGTESIPTVNDVWLGALSLWRTPGLAASVRRKTLRKHSTGYRSRELILLVNTHLKWKNKQKQCA